MKQKKMMTKIKKRKYLSYAAYFGHIKNEMKNDDASTV